MVMQPNLTHTTPFLTLLRHQTFTYTLPPSSTLLTSKTMTLVNPLSHIIKTDCVSLRLPASTIAGLDDEAVLALFTRGFFGGWVFAIEGVMMRLGLYKIFSNKYSGFKSPREDRLIWGMRNVPPRKLISLGDRIFGSFKHLDSHIDTCPTTGGSYVDFCFGSDTAIFGGCQRFSIRHLDLSTKRQIESDETSMLKEEDEIEISLEHFRCNPVKNEDSWAELIPWVHYWYARLLAADAVRSILRR
ncbi:hypothetical protein BJ875DRAFT_218022 [Amylocarpus encephaloides]|uniref:Uncharacterized protein n=1 Tax=Amylocarpus encephaloides TaxID=45428 RepID=A0A9P7YN91_9HELO|nr:hypothetical protein BJ875DRAFT_218022 [Amylocarpus encephaloides]